MALSILITPILRTQSIGNYDVVDQTQQNIEIAREKKAQLDRQLEQTELNQDEYDIALRDLQAALAFDLKPDDKIAAARSGRWLVWVIAVLVPICSVSLYLRLGEYRVIENPILATVPHNTAQKQNMSIETMLERVRQRLRDNPDDAQGWFILGRTLKTMQQLDQAIIAFQRTLDLVGDEPDVMFTLADALATQNNGLMAGEPTRLVNRGLKVAPDNPTGLWLAGLAAEQRKAYKLAHQYWRRMLPQLVEDNESSAEIYRLLAILQQKDPTITAVVPPLTTNINFTVDLAVDLRNQVASTDTVFVYAKATQGPLMPLAVKKLIVADLPAIINLNDGDAMMPRMTLSSFDAVIIGARISKTGNPVAQPGDLYVETDAIDSNNPPENLNLVINQVKF